MSKLALPRTKTVYALEDELAVIAAELERHMDSGYCPMAEAHIQLAISFIKVARQHLDVADLDQTRELGSM